MIDFRSDTVTKPSEAMLKEMLNAELGDDVFRDDPTIQKLEATVAALLGKETSMFVPSGIMANQIAIMTHTSNGDEIICEATSHIVNFEGGGTSALSGVQTKMINGDKGLFTVSDLENVLHPFPGGLAFAPQTLVVIENTCNLAGGSVWPLEQIQGVCDRAHDAGLSTHLDGARLWNASVKSGVKLSEYAERFDSISVCFSKGLGAPIGSCLVGSSQFIAKARRFRTMFGGNMRQSGILAAAALYALKHNIDRLKIDHDNAHRLAVGLASIEGIDCDISSAETNLVYFSLVHSKLEPIEAKSLCKMLHEAGVFVVAIGVNRIRAVLHMHIRQEDVDDAIDIVRSVMNSISIAP